MGVDPSDEVEETPEEGDRVEPAPSDDDDDYEGYFLEPTGNGFNMAEKIAEANKKLLEEEDEENENRTRKVQFDENLVNFEPSYYSDDEYTESARTSIISEEDVDLKIIQEEEPLIENPVEEPLVLEDTDEQKLEENEEEKEEEYEEEIEEELEPEILLENCDELLDDPPLDKVTDGATKLLLVLLPKEQNSSCESLIGEEVPKGKGVGSEEEKPTPEPEKSVKIKMVRPKSAKKYCEMSKISPNLDYSSVVDRKSWQGSKNSSLKSKAKREENEKEISCGKIKVEISKRGVKKINIDNLDLENIKNGEEVKRCCDNRPKSSFNPRRKGPGENRPQTAPMKRTCCVLKTELPQYNGLRSEYGLSAEQLQERKQKTLEIKHQRKQEKIKERQEEIKKRKENEETFQKWLLSKSKRNSAKKPNKLVDTLTRSDVYIQSHASYAANRSVPFSVDYSLNKKIKKSLGKRNKSFVVEELLDKVSPNIKRSFNVYLGLTPQ